MDCVKELLSAGANVDSANQVRQSPCTLLLTLHSIQCVPRLCTVKNTRHDPHSAPKRRSSSSIRLNPSSWANQPATSLAGWVDAAPHSGVCRPLGLRKGATERKGEHGSGVHCAHRTLSRKPHCTLSNGSLSLQFPHTLIPNPTRLPNAPARSKLYLNAHTRD